MLTFSVMGSTRTIAFRPPSVIHGAPSGPTMTPCGREPAPRAICRVAPLGSRRPSAPCACAVYQTPPSTAGATSCGCAPFGTAYRSMTSSLADAVVGVSAGWLALAEATVDGGVGGFSLASVGADVPAAGVD